MEEFSPGQMKERMPKKEKLKDKVAKIKENKEKIKEKIKKNGKRPGGEKKPAPAEGDQQQTPAQDNTTPARRL